MLQPALYKAETRSKSTASLAEALIAAPTNNFPFESFDAFGNLRFFFKSVLVVNARRLPRLSTIGK